MPGDRVERAELVHELLGGTAGQHHVQLREAVAGVGRARQLADLPVEGVESRLRLGGGLLGRGDLGLLPLQDDLGLVELLGDDLELVVGLGDELDGLLGGGRPVRVRCGGARAGR